MKKYTNFNITHAPFEHRHGYSEKIWNRFNMEDHIYHCISAFTTIEIDGVSLFVEFQNGHTYVSNQIGVPSNEYTLYEGGTEDALLKVYDLYESDIEDEEQSQQALEALDAIKAVAPSINTFWKMSELRQYLNDIEPSVSDFIDEKQIGALVFDEDNRCAMEDAA